MTLPQIFAVRGWNSTSLNTLLIRNLCHAMANENQDDPLRAFLKKKDADNWWTTAAKKIAMQSGLKQPDTKEIAQASSWFPKLW
jgi:hypothetical protein